MAITPSDLSVVGFTQFYGDDPNIAYDPTNIRIINQLIESGSLAKMSIANLSAALRSVFGSIIASFQERQLLETDLAQKEAQRAELEAVSEKTPEQIAEIAALTAEIDELKARIAALKTVPDRAVAHIQRIQSQIESEGDKEFRFQSSSDELLTKALSSPREAEDKQQERAEDRFVNDLQGLNYENYKDIIYNLTREVLASRDLENEEKVRLTPELIWSIFNDFGLDLRHFDLSTRDPAVEEMLEPLTELVVLNVIQQEIRGLKEQRIALTNRLTEPQTAPLTPSEVHPLAAEFDKRTARGGYMPPERPREPGKADLLPSGGPLELPVELEKPQESDFLVRNTLLNPPQKSLDALIEAKIEQANALKATLEERLGLELSFMVEDEPGDPAGGSPIADRLEAKHIETPTPAEEGHFAADDDGQDGSRDNSTVAARPNSSEDHERGMMIFRV